MAIARQFVRERAHVAGALHVVLAAQRVHADPGPADIAGRHRQIGDRDDGGGTLAVLGDAEPVIDRAIAAGGEQPRRGAQFRRVYAGGNGCRLRAVLRQRDECGPVLEFAPVAALTHKGFIDQALGDDHMGDCGEHRDVGAGQQRQMMPGFDMGGANDVGSARIDHDQFGAGAQALLQSRSEHRMAVGRIGADDHHDVGMLDGIEILGAGGGAEGARQTIAGRGMADAGAGIDVVVAKTGADQFLHHEHFFIGAA